MEKVIELGKQLGLTGDGLLDFVESQFELDRREARLSLKSYTEQRMTPTKEEVIDKERMLDEEVAATSGGLRLSRDAPSQQMNPSTEEEDEDLQERLENENGEHILSFEDKRRQNEERKSQIKLLRLEEHLAIMRLKRKGGISNEETLKHLRPEVTSKLSSETQTLNAATRSQAKALNPFNENKEGLESYLVRFERFHIGRKLARSEWAANLGPLLCGKALELYVSLLDSAEGDYYQLKQSLLADYRDYTQEKYHCLFREAKPWKSESLADFVLRLKQYLVRWIPACASSDEWHTASRILVKEQFVKSCPKALSAHLKAYETKPLEVLLKIAARFLLENELELYAGDHVKREALGRETRDQRGAKFSPRVSFGSRESDKKSCSTDSFDSAYSYMGGNPTLKSRPSVPNLNATSVQCKRPLPNADRRANELRRHSTGNQLQGCHLSLLCARPNRPKVTSWLPCNKEEFLVEQQSDPLVKKLSLTVKEQVSGKQITKYRKIHGLLFRMILNPNLIVDMWLKELIVPASLRRKVIEIAHEWNLGGHLDAKRTCSRISGNFYWPSIVEDISDYCTECVTCQIEPGEKLDSQSSLSPPRLEVPFKRVVVDFVGPIHPPSEKGHRYILTLTDYGSQYSEATPLKTVTAASVAQALLELYGRLGVPSEVLSSLGERFIDECLQEVERLLLIKYVDLVPVSPIRGVLAGEYNGTLRMMLKQLCHDQPNRWDLYINPLLFLHQETARTSGFSPFGLLYGKTVRGPMALLREIWVNDDIEETVRRTYQSALEIRKKAKTTITLAETVCTSEVTYKTNFGKKMRKRTLVKGDLALVLAPTDRDMMLMCWKGPFKVVEKFGDENVLNVEGRSSRYHANAVKKYVQPLSDPWDSLQPRSNSSSSCETTLSCFDTAPEDPLALIEFSRQLSAEQRAQAQKLVSSYAGVFSGEPGSLDTVRHHIILKDDKALRSKQSVVQPGDATNQQLRFDIDEMVRRRVIRRSRSKFAASLVTSSGREGCVRVYIDFRKLNSATVFDPEPLPSARDILRKTAEKNFFSNLDLNMGCWQIRVADEDVHKTAFASNSGLYEFLKMPFGLANSAATFVRAMRPLLCGLEAHVTCCMNDLVVHTHTWSEHLLVLGNLLDRFKAAGATVKPCKCSFGLSGFECLGYDLLRTQEEISDDFRFVSRPTGKKEVQVFVNAMKRYGHFIQNYATTILPLSELTSNGNSNLNDWGTAQERSFQVLKSCLVSQPILRPICDSKAFVLRTATSQIAFACVLLQHHYGRLHPVFYARKTLSSEEHSFSFADKECLGALWGVKKLRVYLYRGEFVLQTSSKTLAGLGMAKLVGGAQVRCAMYLQTFRVRFQLIKCQENALAEFLSR